LGAVFPHFCPDKREIWHGEARSLCQISRLSGQRVASAGEKPVFGPLNQTNARIPHLPTKSRDHFKIG